MTDTTSPAVESSPDRIVARPGRYYRNARLIMVAAIVAFGVYFLYDGFIGWPERNRKIDAVEAELKGNPTVEQKAKADKALSELGSRKNDTDILLQKVLGFGLPVLAGAYTVFFLRRSRGQVVWENGLLTHPGHPPLTLGQMTSIENKMWKKKGIAFLKYDTGAKRGVIRLDTFFHDEKAMDAIYDIIAKHLGVSEPPATAAKKPSQD